MAATSAPRIGVLAIQGAFREHVRSLCLCGAETVEIRTREDLEGLSGLVFPGGESTVMGKFLIEWGMMGRVRELIQSGMPVFGTCAGLILLCSDILDHPEQPHIGLLNASVRRNAFADRQLHGSAGAVPIPRSGRQSNGSASPRSRFHPSAAH